jgi:hypothetical protein
VSPKATNVILWTSMAIGVFALLVVMAIFSAVGHA